MKRAHVLSTLARIFCGAVFLMHGIPKIFNLQGTGIWFANEVGVPGWLAVPIAFLEFFGGILLIVGFVTRVLATLFTLEMLGAIVFFHWSAGWDFMEGGYEYNIALIILLLGVILLGPGPLSVDARLGWGGSAAAVDDDLAD